MCILVSCVISFEHINGRTKEGLSMAHLLYLPYKSVTLKIVSLEDGVKHVGLKRLFVCILQKHVAFVKTMESDFFSPPLTKSPNSSFLKWALRRSHKNSVFPCSGYPACKGGLEGLCLTPETQPRRWTGAK